MMRFFHIAQAAILSALIAVQSPAATIQSSTFDSDSEGWTMGDLRTGAAAGLPTYVAAGGNPGGFLRTLDVTDAGWTAYFAPAPFLGNWAALNVTSISWDLRLGDVNICIDCASIALTNGTTTIWYFDAGPNNTGFTTLSAPLTSPAGWEYPGTGFKGGGTPVTNADFLAVLGNVTEVRISADWISLGFDQTDLDNVVLTGSDPAPAAIPEPSTYALFGSASAILLFVRRRRNTA